MLIGEYETQLGEKNRVAIPKKLRDQLTGEIILTRGYENCLILLDKKRWERLIDEVNLKPLLSLNVRDTKRYLIGGANEIEPDNQGRFVLSESLKSFSQIEKDIVFLGVGEWIELWSIERWKKKLKELANNVSDVAERLSQ